VILHLADPVDVRRSASLDPAAPVYWVSPRPPEQLCGFLAGGVQGAWVVSARIEVRVPGCSFSLELPAGAAIEPVALAELALRRALAGSGPDASGTRSRCVARSKPSPDRPRPVRFAGRLPERNLSTEP